MSNRDNSEFRTRVAMRLAALNMSMRAASLAAGMSADTLGKFKTSFQSTALGFLLWQYPTTLWPHPRFHVEVHSAGLVLMYLALFFTPARATNYIVPFFRHAATSSRPTKGRVTILPIRCW